MSVMPHARMRSVAAFGVAAIASAGLSIAATPATAATAAPVTYTCSAAGGLMTDLKFTATADTNAPASLMYGRTVTPRLTARISIDDTTANLLRNLGASNVSGSGSVQALVNGAQSNRAVTIAKTAVPAEGPMTVTATGAFTAIKGSRLGTVTLALKNFSATLKMTKANGQPTDLVSEAGIDCVQDADQNNTVDTLKVVQGTSTTATRLAYAKATKTITATATVSPKAAGKVSFVVTKNGKKFKTVAATVNSKSQAVAKLAKLGKGTYKVVAKYVGNANLKASTAKAVSKKI